MSLAVEKLHPFVAARLSGLDLSRPLSEAAFARILDALNDHQVLVFSGQALTQRQLLAFGQRFGEAEIFPDPTERIGEVPQVLRLTNLNDDNEPTGPSPRMQRMSLAENWHTDSSYRRVPSFITILHGIEIPPVGGQTHFTSMHAAYDALPADLRRRIEPLSAVHSWEYQRMLTPGRQPMTEQERASTPPIRHRLVQTHPATGRKLLYISSSAQRIEGLLDSESRALLDELARLSTRPEAIYTHDWRPNDVVIWDNRATLHRAGTFDYQSLILRRLLHRVVIAGDPAAYPVGESEMRVA